MPMVPHARQLGHALNVVPLATRQSPGEDYASLDHVMPDGDHRYTPVKLEDEDDDDTYILNIPGVRSFGIKRGCPDGAYTAPSKLQASAAWSPKNDLVQLPRRLDFLPVTDKSIVHRELALSVEGVGKKTVEESLIAVEQANDRDTYMRLYSSVLERVAAQKVEVEKHRKSWKEMLDEKESTISRLKNEIRDSQDDLLKHKREVEDLRASDLLKYKRDIEDLETKRKRETEDLKEALLQQSAAKVGEIEDLQAALGEANVQLAGMKAKHEKEIEALKSSIEDQHRNRLEKLKAEICAAFNNYSSEAPESSSVQFTAQISLCKQEEIPGDSGNH